jgi:hypothetical protein
MHKYETYIAKAKGTQALAMGAPALAAAPAQPASAFRIEVRFAGGLTETQKDAFKAAADRWTKVIVGSLPAVEVDGEVIDHMVIMAQGQDIDGEGGILGQAGPTALRPRSAGAAAFIPLKGTMAFDTADLANMETKGTLRDVITHEMGHVLGFGTIWQQKKLLKGPRSNNPQFTGHGAEVEFGKLKGTNVATLVPLENTGGQGTFGSHWRETIFRNELMTGFVASPGNPLSALTIASLADLGYTVDLSVAEPYTLPNIAALAEAGLLMAEPEPGIMLRTIPLVMPDETLQ